MIRIKYIFMDESLDGLDVISDIAPRCGEHVILLNYCLKYKDGFNGDNFGPYRVFLVKSVFHIYEGRGFVKINHLRIQVQNSHSDIKIFQL